MISLNILSFSHQLDFNYFNSFMVNIFPSASLNPCRKSQAMNKLKQTKRIDSSDKLSQTLSFIHLFNKHVSTGYMPSIFLSILFCNSESSSEKSIQENARITEPSWLILFTHRDQVICGVYRLKKEEKLTVLLDIPENWHHPPTSCSKGSSKSTQQRWIWKGTNH